jgi:hypothetical protein
MNTARDRILVISFLLMICLPIGGTFFVQSPVVSEVEKRKLSEFPRIAFNYQSLKSFPENYSAYIGDHFLFRSEMVNMNSFLRMKLFHSSPTFSLAVGQQGWLYSLSDWALHDYMGGSRLTARQLEVVRLALEQRKRLVGSWGGTYLHVLVPNKMIVYPDYLPQRIRKKRGETMVDQIMGFLSAHHELESTVLDLTEVLSTARDDNLIYYQTDTHWTSYGAFVGYQAILAKLQEYVPDIEILTTDNLVEKEQKNTVGDLALMGGVYNFVSETSDVFHPKDFCRSAENTAVPVDYLQRPSYPQRNGCPRANPHRVVLISDSFGDALQPFFSETFQEVIYDRNVGFPELYPFLREYEPDIVINVTVQRFLGRSFVYSSSLDTQ